MPDPVAARNWTFFRSEDDFPAAVESLVAALDSDLDWVRAHTRLLGWSLEWEKRDRDPSFLLRGRDLRRRRAMDSGTVGRPRAAADPFAAGVRAREPQRRHPPAAHHVSAALVAVGVAASLALLAWLQRNEAVEQQAVAERQARLSLSRQLAAQSQAVLGRDPEQSLVLAARAATTLRRTRLATSSAARCAALLSRSVIDAGEPVRGAALDGQGRLVAAALESGGVGVWNLRTGRRLTTLRSAALAARARCEP